MQDNIKEYYGMMLNELSETIAWYKNIIDSNKEIAEVVEDIKKYILDVAENAGSDAQSENDFIKKSSAKIKELQAMLIAAHKTAHWKNKQPEVGEHPNYVFTDDLNRLRKELKQLDSGCVKKFKDRLKVIREDFKLEQNRDTSKFESANNKQTYTKDQCETILRDNEINGIAWEIKCTSGTTAARFAAVQDLTNTRWFIYSEYYSHKDNKSNVQEVYLARAVDQYCKNINNLEAIPEDLIEQYIEDRELDELAEQLWNLLEL